jgi:hypothetical protein
MVGVHRWCAAAPALLALFVLCSQRQGASAQKLPGHSISTPPDLYSLVADWFLAGTVVPTHQAMVLNPGIPNRMGMMWSSFPLLTNNFEVSATFRGKKPDKRNVKDEGFAFWYVYENGTKAHHNISFEHAQNQEEIIADTWKNSFTEAGMDLFGYRSKYDGLGVFFVNEESPSVCAIPNDGQKTFKLGQGIPTYDAVKYDFLNGEFSVRIHIQPDSAKIEVGGHTIDVKSAFKPGGYIGFTVFGGLKVAPDAQERAGHLELVSLTTTNRDASAQGEEVRTTQAPPPPVPADEKVDVLAEASTFKDHRAESDAIKDLTNMVFKLVVETQPMRQQMAKAIESLGKRIDIMETNFAELKSELDKKTGHKLGAEFDAIKKELTSLSAVASKETEERHSRLESLHADIADVHKTAHSPDNIDKHLDKLTQSNSKVLDQLTNEHQRMFGVSIAAIAFVIIAGLSLYNKFRCWEKKHVL